MNEVTSSALSGLPAGPSPRLPSWPGPSSSSGALGWVGVGFPILPPRPSPGSRRGRSQALRSPPRLLPKLGPQAPGGWRPPPAPDTEGGRAGGPGRASAGRLGQGGGTVTGLGRGAACRETGPVRLVRARSRARRGRVPAEPAAAGRGRLGHALFIAEPPAARRPRRRRRLPRFPRAGCGLRRGAGARSLHNIVAAPRVTAQGRRGCAAWAAGGGRQRELGLGGVGVGAMRGHAAWGRRGGGAQARMVCGFADRQGFQRPSLHLSVHPSVRSSPLPSVLPSIRQPTPKGALLCARCRGCKGDQGRQGPHPDKTSSPSGGGGRD